MGKVTDYDLDKVIDSWEFENYPEHTVRKIAIELKQLRAENAKLRGALNDHRITIRAAICELKEHIPGSKLVEELCDFVTKSQREALEGK